MGIRRPATRSGCQQPGAPDGAFLFGQWRWLLPTGSRTQHTRTESSTPGHCPPAIVSLLDGRHKEAVPLLPTLSPVSLPGFELLRGTGGGRKAPPTNIHAGKKYRKRIFTLLRIRFPNTGQRFAQGSAWMVEMCGLRYPETGGNV